MLDRLDKALSEWRWWTGAVIIATIAGLSLWEVIVIWRAPLRARLSPVIISFLWNHPSAALAVGVLIGHLMWPVKFFYQPGMTWKYWVLGVILAIVLVLDVVAVLPLVVPVIYAMVGVFLGHYLFPQRLRV